MRIAICDDNPRCREDVSAFVREYADAHLGAPLSASVFSHAEDLLEAVGAKGDFDIYFLDVIMPDMNGIELGKQLRSHNCSGKIIYLTSSPDYAVDAFRVKAYDYLLKPITRSSVFKLLDELLAASAKPEKNFIVKTRESSVRMSYDTLQYATLIKRAVLYCRTDGSKVESTTIRTSFSEAMAALLQDPRFVLCGAGLVVNLSHVTSIGDGALHFRSGEKIYPGVKALRELRGQWYDYWFDKEPIV